MKLFLTTSILELLRCQNGQAHQSKHFQQCLNLNNNYNSHTSGVIAQATDANVQIIPVKVLDYNGDGYASDPKLQPQFCFLNP